MKLGRTLFISAVSFLMISTSVQAAPTGLSDFPEPIDKESWVLPENMTWDDYNPVPGFDWRNTDIEPEKEIKGALVVVDFSDRDFILSMEEGSELAGNPIVGNIPREDIPQYWVDFLNKPQELNNHRTIDEYWRENSFGKWAVDLEAFGPYKMSGREFQYGLSRGHGQDVNMPPGYEALDLKNEAMAAAAADIEATGEEYDFTFILHAGYDESGVWQEFGEMMFQDKEDVSDQFGPPAEFANMPKFANTRYVDWTSWIAASSIWSSADIRNGISIQGENDGMGTFAHEFGHIMNLLDNYNNPYASPVSRTYSGPWELMSRGSFNGPGGPHTRWMVMPTLGASAPSHHMLRNKIKQGFLAEEDYMNVDRDELAETGPVFADILAREIPVGSEFGREDVFAGINIEMEDLTPPNSLRDDWRADMQRGAKWYDNYTVEVVDRVGYDSFQTDAGVLLAKTKNAESAPNIWVVDANDEDIDQVDFVRPNGSIAKYSKGDYRQLADALFKAGTDEGIINEYVDEHNRLHFYILAKDYDDIGALSYRVAVRHLDGAGSFARGVEAEGGTAARAVPGKIATHNFKVTNTGEETDLFRLTAETEAGWETRLMHNVIEVEAGETVEVPVYVEVPEDETGLTKLNFSAASETDESKTGSATDVLTNDISAKGIKAVASYYEEQGEFANSAVARQIQTHLTSVALYESQKSSEKVIKHTNSFKQMVSKFKDSDLISEDAATALLDYSDYLVLKWQ
ncbi:M6 family metalloprotease domain-containing protein [Cytobacillus purgationiresistens]|uniref:M6 family metalloprotease-like protein n=1 Tax=Cytobacillus purgationiresistens TaxID=863449 RepID=A0ABU0AGV5_9BACI|nr:M6 family metalloprotease domain-containing protein [Cytobacillus purgationiresistens]MDQ0270493.1 M6 family metalloprotease-like protein [Cytobacillus purgationiresistens]